MAKDTAAEKINSARRKMWAAIPDRDKSRKEQSLTELPELASKQINEAHLFARECAETAIEHAKRAGELLAEAKMTLPRGSFDSWVAKYCEFGRSMAYNYLKVSQSSNAVGLKYQSIRQALGYESMKPSHKAKPNSPKGAVQVVNPKGTGETGADRPAAPASPPTPPQASASPPSAGEPEWTDADEAAVVAEQDADEQSRIAKAMAADDKLAEAFAQIKLQAGEIAVLKRSRDHYMNQAGEAARLVQARDREIAKLKKQISRQAA